MTNDTTDTDIIGAYLAGLIRGDQPPAVTGPETMALLAAIRRIFSIAPTRARFMDQTHVIALSALTALSQRLRAEAQAERVVSTARLH